MGNISVKYGPTGIMVRVQETYMGHVCSYVTCIISRNSMKVLRAAFLMLINLINDLLKFPALQAHTFGSKVP